MLTEITRDIRYVPSSSEPRQVLDLYRAPASLRNSSSGGDPLLVYIHGGSWRSGDKNEYESLGSAVCHLNGTRAVAIINYRLSVRGLEPQFVHPGHLLDVARALRFLYRSGPSFGYDSSRIHISGHSAGAQLVSLLVLQPIHLITVCTEADTGLPAPATPFASAQDEAFAILDAITHVSGVGGIFDIPKLMADYPTYIDFIEMAFGPESHGLWTSGSPTLVDALPEYLAALPAEKRTKFLVLQSTEDELINFNQPRGFVEKLKELGLPVQENFELLGTHFDALKLDGFFKALADFDPPTRKDLQ